jgi:hypothetical protein
MGRPKTNHTCTAPNCNRPAHTKQLCNTHYRRHLRGQPLDTPIGHHTPKAPTPCTTPHCNRHAIARGLCNLHYLRWRRGTPIDRGDTPPPQTRSCEHPNCDNPHQALGLCLHHYRAEWTRARRGR